MEFALFVIKVPDIFDCYFYSIYKLYMNLVIDFTEPDYYSVSDL